MLRTTIIPPGKLKLGKLQILQGRIRKKLEERTIFCAFENKKLVGTIGLEGKEVVGLYVSYSNIGKGVGKALLNHLEEFAERNGIIDLGIDLNAFGKTVLSEKRIFRPRRGVGQCKWC